MSAKFRGQMPYRRSSRLRAIPLTQQGRGGEPSPESNWILAYLQEREKINKEGRYKAHGSFTEAMRTQLERWVEQKTGLPWYQSEIIFEFKVSRHQTVSVVMRAPTIWHKPEWGKGRAGFVLVGLIVSWNGLEPTQHNRLGMLSFNRIVGQFPQLFLESGG